MKKVTLTTILLLLLTSISVLAQNDTKIEDAMKNSDLIQTVDAMTTQDQIIDAEVTSSTDQILVAVIVKHETFKSTSRKSRMKTVVNFLKNPEKKETKSPVLC